MTRSERYRAAIDSLIPQAAKYADANATEEGGRTARQHRWNHLFHSKMDELAAKRGLRRLAYQGRKA